MTAFVLLAIVMVAGAVGVVTFRQPVHAALSLVGTLLTLAVTYVTLQAHFLAAIQVIVYAGAIMVLFLFVIMLLNIQGDAPARTPHLRWMRIVAPVAALVAAVGIGWVAFTDPRQLPTAEIVDAALGGGGAGAMGEALFSEFALAFQLVGVLLLTGILGAVSLVQRRAVGIGPDTPVVPPAKVPGTRVAGGRVAVRGASERGARAALDAAMDADASAAAGAVAADDDLQRIKGIGPKLETVLHENGITRFEQIAGLDAEAIERLDEQLGFSGRIERDGWVEQARALIAEREG